MGAKEARVYYKKLILGIAKQCGHYVPNGRKSTRCVNELEDAGLLKARAYSHYRWWELTPAGELEWVKDTV